MRTKNEVDRDEFETMYLNYVPKITICAHFGIGQKRMMKIRDELGLSPRKTRCSPRNHGKIYWYDLKRYRWDEFDYEMFKQMYLDGTTKKRMRERFDINDYVFYKIRDKLGLPNRSSSKKAEGEQ